MKIIKISENPEELKKIVFETIRILKAGGVVIYPTDTLYALGANALDPLAVEKIFKIKKRPKTKPLPIAVRNIKWAKELAFIYQKEERILKAIWPGPVMVILQKRDIVPDILTAGKQNVAMRVPNHFFVDKILGRFGYPLTSTSANISKELPSYKISEIVGRFKEENYKPDLIIDAGNLKESEPSTILDLTSFKPKILRVGPVKPDVLREILKV